MSDRFEWLKFWYAYYAVEYSKDRLCPLTWYLIFYITFIFVAMYVVFIEMCKTDIDKIKRKERFDKAWNKYKLKGE